jgi:FKBP-type peptidyl-prolyl cis-trans isomerase
MPKIKLNIFCVFILISTGLAAQKKDSIATINKSPSPGLSLKSTQDSIQYALGAYMGKYLLNGGFFIVDPDLFLPGLEDVFQQKKLILNDSVIYGLIANYQSVYQKLSGTRAEEKLFIDLKNKTGVLSFGNGVFYELIQQGKGSPPDRTDSVKLQVKGSLANGNIFEDTYQKKMPITTKPNLLIPVLADVLIKMLPGSIWKLYIPSSKAYAEKGNGTNIPPYSALVIQLELLEVKKGF